LNPNIGNVKVEVCPYFFFLPTVSSQVFSKFAAEKIKLGMTPSVPVTGNKGSQQDGAWGGGHAGYAGAYGWQQQYPLGGYGFQQYQGPVQYYSSAAMPALYQQQPQAVYQKAGGDQSGTSPSQPPLPGQLQLTYGGQQQGGN